MICEETLNGINFPKIIYSLIDSISSNPETLSRCFFKVFPLFYKTRYFFYILFCHPLLRIIDGGGRLTFSQNKEKKRFYRKSSWYEGVVNHNCPRLDATETLLLCNWQYIRLFFLGKWLKNYFASHMQI